MYFPQTKKGMALIIVLIISVMLNAFAIYFISELKINLKNVELIYNKSIAYLNADSMRDEITFSLYSEGFINKDVKGWNHWGEVFDYDAQTKVSIQDLSAAVSLVPFHTSEWEFLLKSKNVDEQLIENLIDEVSDWQDQDTFRRLAGKEKQHYLSAKKRAIPRNRSFQSKHELKNVFSMTDALFEQIENSFVYYGSSNRSPKYAMPELVNYYFQDKAATELMELRNAHELDRVARFYTSGNLQRGSDDVVVGFLSGDFIINLDVNYKGSRVKKSFMVSSGDTEARPFFYASVE